MANVMYVICDGNPDYAGYCLPSLDKYAKRIDADLIIIDGSYMQPQYPNNHFLIYECYKHFVKSNYERMLFSDLDILINPATPSVFDTFTSGMWLRQGWDWKIVSDYAMKAFGEDVSGYADRYYSCGFAVVGQKEAQKLVDLFDTKPWVIGPWGGNQGQFNYFLSQTDIIINVLPIKWHFSRSWDTQDGIAKFGGEHEALKLAGCGSLRDIYVLHYAGGGKADSLEKDGIYKDWV